MNANITTKPQLGKGIYTIPDAAVILDLPGEKIRRWIKKYREMEFAGAERIPASLHPFMGCRINKLRIHVHS
jgi:hypothetical protein